MGTFGGRKSSPESTMTQSDRSQPNQAPKSSTFGGMGQRLAQLCGAKGGAEGEGQGAADLEVSGSLAFVGVQNKDVTPTIMTVTTGSGYVDSTHKLIDLGTAVAVHDVGDDEANDTLKTATEMEFAG